MPSRRDLIEARAFARRRLVTALLRGRPGLDRSEPQRTGRCLVIGTALAALLLAAAALGLVDPSWTPEASWPTLR